MSRLPRGIRNNNPGNIEKGDPWQGLAKDQSGDSRFAVFESPKWGIRALARLLITYQDKHGLRTIRQIINRWAPPVENDTLAYAKAVAAQVGRDIDDPVDVHRYEHAEPIVRAIIQHENGQQPYDLKTINEGLRLAGIEPPAEAEKEALDEVLPLPKTRSVKGGQVAAGAGGVAVVSGLLGELAPALPILHEIGRLVRENGTEMLILLGLVALAGAGYTIYARWDDRRKGLR